MGAAPVEARRRLEANIAAMLDKDLPGACV